MASPSARGRQQDYKSVRLCKKFAGHSHMISAASKGAFDVHCWSSGGGLFIQNKTNRLPPRTEQLALIRARVPIDSIKVIMVWLDKKRWPRFLLVTNTDIKELPRKEAEELMRKVFKCRLEPVVLKRMKRRHNSPGKTLRTKLPLNSRDKKSSSVSGKRRVLRANPKGR